MSWSSTIAHRLLVSLRVGPILAKLGPGARLVALSSAAHASRVALIWPARVGRRQGQERLKRGLPKLKAALPYGLDNQWCEQLRNAMSTSTDRVVIGMDPHKRSVTIEVMANDETILGGGRYGTDVEGYRSLVRYASSGRSEPRRSKAAKASAST
jgi:hypothetical protein